jgi:2-polyprenyl-3-methyl-5-hydroxy-6-metoxy-1,4-benzoquinol methylase
MNQHDLSEKDPAGQQTLEQFAEARKFNKWLFNTILPYCKGKVLEAGSGIGNISELLLEHGFHLTATDVKNEYCIRLRNRFSGQLLLDDVLQLDLSNPDLAELHPELQSQFDTVIASNVIEHIEDDRLAVRNCKNMLKRNGHLILLVPAYQLLYNSFDRELGHYRRYNTKQLKELLESENMKLIHCGYFNAAGLAGWIVSGGLLKKKLIPKNQLLFFEKLVPLIKLFDTITFNRIGVSVISIARKP